MTDEETRNSQYWEERSEELSSDELKEVSGGLLGLGNVDAQDLFSNPKGSVASVKKGLEDLDSQAKKGSGLKYGDDFDIK